MARTHMMTSDHDCGGRRARLQSSLTLARVAQLELARAGRVIESASFADRARVLRSALETRVSGAGFSCAGLALALVVLLAPRAAQAQATTVRTAEVSEQMVQDHRRVTGSLQAVSRAAIASQEEGLIQSVAVDEGSTVKKGETIARLDSRRLQAQLEEAKAELANYTAVVAQREAEVKFARLDLDRVGEARRLGAANEREASLADTEVGVRVAQLDAARKVVDSISRRIDLLQIRLEDTEVKAPFDARVVHRFVEPGEWIEPGEPLVTLVSVGQIEARLNVPERYAEKLLSGVGELYVEIGADGRSVPSISVRPVPDIDPRARTFEVIVTIDNQQGALAPGMSVNAWVPTTDQHVALLAPKDAVVRDGRDAYVYRVSTEGGTRAERTPVTVLFSSGEHLALGANPALTPGDRVIIEGNERLMPGAEISLASFHETAGKN